MADYTDLITAMALGEAQKKAIADSNPYASGAKVADTLAQTIATAGPQYSLKEKLIYGALTGLLGGGLQSISDNYNARAANAYQDVVRGSLLGGTIAKPDVLSDTLFQSAKSQGDLFALQRKLAVEQQDASAKAELKKAVAGEAAKAIAANPRNVGRVVEGLRQIGMGDLFGPQSSPIAKTASESGLIERDITQDATDKTAAISNEIRLDEAYNRYPDDETARRQFLLETDPDIQAAKIDQKKRENDLALELEKSKSGLSKKGEIPASFVTDLATNKALINESREIADLLEKGGSWGSLRLAKNFSGLDDNGIALRLSNLTERYKNSLTGAASSAKQDATFQKLLGGDLTASPQKSAKLLRELADQQESFANSQIDIWDSFQNEGVSGLRKGFTQAQNKTSDGGTKTTPVVATVSSQDIQSEYNRLRASGLSAAQASAQLGIR